MARAMTRGLLLAALAPTLLGAKPAPPVDELVVRPAAECLAAKLDMKVPDPRIVSTWPAEGATVRPGVLVIRVTFDRPMTCQGFLGPLPPFRTPCAAEHQTLVLSFDRRIVRVVCKAAPLEDYAVMVGARPKLFVSLAAHDAQPYALIFHTSAGPPVASISEALAQDPDAPKPRR